MTQVDRHPRPLLPYIRVIGEAPERERGRLLFGLAPERIQAARLEALEANARQACKLAGG